MSERDNDIERYLNGDLTPRERHQLEKKSLSDPFLRHALEGGESLSGAAFSADMDQIRNDLEERTLSDVVLPVAMQAEASFAGAGRMASRSAISKKSSPQKRNLRWPLGVAAGILIALGIVFITGKLSDERKVDQLALQKPAPVPEVTPQPDAAKSEVQHIQEADQSRTKEEHESPTSSNNSRESRPENEEIDSQGAITLQDEAKNDTKEIPDNPAAEDKSREPVKESEAAKVVAAEPVVVAPTQTYSNPMGGSSAPAPSRSLSRKKSVAAESSAAKDDAETETAKEMDGPSPVDGVLQFAKYVQDNLRYPQEARNNNIEGDVIVDFQINANGSSDNFTIIKGLGFGCDEEAVRLIKEGPKWNRGFQNTDTGYIRSRVTIPFHLKK